MASLPVSANAPILAQIYKSDRDLSLSLVEVSTLFSIATIPLIMLITQKVLELRA